MSAMIAHTVSARIHNRVSIAMSDASDTLNRILWTRVLCGTIRNATCTHRWALPSLGRASSRSSVHCLHTASPQRCPITQCKRRPRSRPFVVARTNALTPAGCAHLRPQQSNVPVYTARAVGFIREQSRNSAKGCLQQKTSAFFVSAD